LDETSITSFSAFLDGLLNEDINYSFKSFSKEFILPIPLKQSKKII